MTIPKDKMRSAIALVKSGETIAESARRHRISYATLKAHFSKHTDEPMEPMTKNKDSVVMAIPDLHCPFHHPDSLDFLQEVQRKFQPTDIVCLGDEIDAHNYSKWPKDPDGLSAGQELRAAVDSLTPFYLAFPDMKVCVSNHTVRPQKMMKAIGLPSAFFPSYSTMLNAPDGWEWKEHWIVDGVRYMHGDQGKTGNGGWAVNSDVYHESCVVGHWHSNAGVAYRSDKFNLNAGCLIDEKAYVFDYARHSHKRPNLGCGIVKNGRQAYFIPMVLDENHRWIRRL